MKLRGPELEVEPCRGRGGCRARCEIRTCRGPTKTPPGVALLVEIRPPIRVCLTRTKIRDEE